MATNLFFRCVDRTTTSRNTEQLHAWFSLTARIREGYCIYLNTENNEVAVTEVNRSNIPSSKWPDLTYVGRVTTFVKTFKSPYCGSTGVISYR